MKTGDLKIFLAFWDRVNGHLGEIVPGAEFGVNFSDERLELDAESPGEPGLRFSARRDVPEDFGWRDQISCSRRSETGVLYIVSPDRLSARASGEWCGVSLWAGALLRALRALGEDEPDPVGRSLDWVGDELKKVRKEREKRAKKTAKKAPVGED